MSISVCILAKNEEKNIRECVESVKNIADEIIVVNNNSEDDTKKIALKCGCKVIDSPDTVLDQGRNVYMEVAKSEWTFIIDADERLDCNDKEKIFSAIENVKTRKEVLAFTLDSYQYTGRGRWSTVKFIRMVRNGKGIRYQDTPIHSDLETSILSKGGIIEHCPAYIHHLDILINNRTKFKREKYKDYIIKKIQDEPRHTVTGGYLRCFLGLEFAAVEKFEEAERLYHEVIVHNGYIKDFAKIFLAQNYILQKQYEKAEEVISSIDSHNHTIDYQICPMLAEIYQFTNRKEKAIRIILNEVERQPEVAHHYINLAILYLEDDPVKAIKNIVKAQSINSYVLNPLIYSEGEKPNIFGQQTCIISSEYAVMEIMKEGCFMAYEKASV